MKRLILAFTLLAAPAGAQIITPAASGFQRLYATGTSVGNSADTTEDILQTFTLPAGQLSNVGDTIRVFASGTCAASTDTKTVRLRFGGVAGTSVSALTCSAAGQTAWSIEVFLVKTASSTQSYGSVGIVANTNSAPKAGTAALTDTSTIQVVVTGQDSTAATANAVTAQITIMDYMH